MSSQGTILTGIKLLPDARGLTAYKGISCKQHRNYPEYWLSRPEFCRLAVSYYS